MGSCVAITSAGLLTLALIGCERQPSAKPSEAAPIPPTVSASHDQPNALTLQLCLAARPADSAAVQEAKAQLAGGSMDMSLQGESFRWVALRRLSDLTADDDQLKAIQEDAEGTFARNFSLVVARTGDAYYVLVHANPEACMMLTPQTLRGASMTLDALGRSAIALEMTDDGKAEEKRLVNHVDRIAVVLNDQVVACSLRPPWICDQEQTSASKQRLEALAEVIDKHFRQR
jgi:hypothetical protein